MKLIQTVPADFVHVQPLAPCLIGNIPRTAMNLITSHTCGAYAKFTTLTKPAHCIVLRLQNLVDFSLTRHNG
jgi:hypothetical protein